MERQTNITGYEKPELNENAPKVPEGDFIADSNAPMYYISIDSKGRLGWKEHFLYYCG
jgi:hypothetical protein